MSNTNRSMNSGLPDINQSVEFTAPEAVRSIQEVQGAIVLAKKFPRDEIAAKTKLLKTCDRLTFAKDASYAYPRGGELVTGPSIRLAEAAARLWGNLQYGVQEIEQNHNETVLEAYCWDLETNTRASKRFTVPHVRYSRNKGRQSLSNGDPRDVYEAVANQGARRLRAMILAVIPSDVIEDAEARCRATIEKGDGTPLKTRIEKMVFAFDEIGVDKDMIEERLGHKIEATIAQELVTLQGIYKSITDGYSKREDHFKLASVEKELKKAEKDLGLDDKEQAKPKEKEQKKKEPVEEKKEKNPSEVIKHRLNEGAKK